MKLIRLGDLFDIRYSKSLELINCVKDKNGINFISRTSVNNGISSKIKKRYDIDPMYGNCITVALGGSVLSSFYQSEPFYTSFHIGCLYSIQNLTKKEMLYYCMVIEKNKYRYSFGRQANITLKDILIPDLQSIPQWIYDTNVKVPSNKPVVVSENKLPLNMETWQEFELQNLFSLKRGKLSSINEVEKGEVFVVSSSELNNGVINILDIEKKCIEDANCITVANNGSVGATFYQAQKFAATSDITILRLKDIMLNKYSAIFICTIIRQEKYRFNYGRKWGLNRMKESKIKLPATQDGKPDWQFMENYIKSLPYSKSL